MKKIILIMVFLFSMNFVAGTSNVLLSLVNQDPDPVASGDIVEIRIGAENIGDTAVENSILEIVPSYPFSVPSGESALKKIGTLSAFQTEEEKEIIKFKLKINDDAKEGTYDLTVIQYEEGKKSVGYVQNTISIDVQSKEKVEINFIDKFELSPGQKETVQFTINNVGSSKLNDLSFSWENEDDVILPVGSDNTKFIDAIEVGASTLVSYDVIADSNADPGLYKLNLVLKNSNGDILASTFAGMYIGGATDFDVAFSGVASSEYSFSISNIGSVSASSVTVKVPDQSDWKVSGSSSVIIGNLNEGDYTIAGFTLQQKTTGFSRGTETEQTSEKTTDTTQRTMPEDSTVVLEISYTDSRGTRETLTKEVAVSASNTISSSDKEARMAQFQKQQNPVSSFWSDNQWTIIIAVVVGGGFVWYKKRKKK